MEYLGVFHCVSLLTFSHRVSLNENGSPPQGDELKNQLNASSEPPLSGNILSQLPSPTEPDSKVC